MMNQREIEKEYIRRVDYRFKLNDKKTQDVFDTITNVMYKEFNNNPSYANVYLKLKQILDGGYDEFNIENKIRLNVLESRYNLSKTDIMDSIRKIVMSSDTDSDEIAIMHYLMYLYLKCKLLINYEYIINKLEEDFNIKINNIKYNREIKYVDNELSVIKIGLPKVDDIIKKDDNEPKAIK